jgi:hypothetical protein
VGGGLQLVSCSMTIRPNSGNRRSDIKLVSLDSDSDSFSPTYAANKKINEKTTNRGTLLIIHVLIRS